MYDFIKPILSSKGFQQVVLEVISNNTPAIKSYHKIGFKQVRNLSCFSGKLHIDEINNDIEIKKSENPDFEELGRIGEVVPTWQNAIETINNLGDDALCYLAYTANMICGYMVLNKTNNRILQIAVKIEMRHKHVGSSLLNYIQNEVSESTSIINVDSNFSDTLHFFESKNLTKSLTQEEMLLKLGSSQPGL